jgi:tetratricopeptide (TPR) repeat protein
VRLKKLKLSARAFPVLHLLASSKGVLADTDLDFIAMQLEDMFKSAQKLAQRGQLENALHLLNGVLPSDAYRADFKIIRARILLAMQRKVDALSDIDDADAGQGSGRLLGLRAEVEEQLGRPEAAIHTLTRALEIVPNASLYARRSNLLQGAGKFDDARADLKAAIALRPNEGELYRLYSPLHKFTHNDPLLDEMRRTYAALSKGSVDRMGFEFALAKAMDDIGDFEGAFGYLKQANAEMRRRFPYDINSRLTAVQQYKERFEAFDPTDYRVADQTDYAPIFITGMPRSGTTLVEQIISSHVHVQAGGETARFLPRMIETIGDPTTPDFKISAEKIRVLGQRYHADMLENLHIAKRHTDKSIQSILYAGPILAALPKAKIIVVTRNPKAVALSLYRHAFKPGKQLFSYDLKDIRAYGESYNEMVAFWHQRIPSAILPITYEDVVTRPEPTIRRMLDFAGLAWDDTCLRPEKNKRLVRTLSSVAVREAIGTTKRDHWQNYKHYLEAVF